MRGHDFKYFDGLSDRIIEDYEYMSPTNQERAQNYLNDLIAYDEAWSNEELRRVIAFIAENKIQGDWSSIRSLYKRTWHEYYFAELNDSERTVHSSCLETLANCFPEFNHVTDSTIYIDNGGENSLEILVNGEQIDTVQALGMVTFNPSRTVCRVEVRNPSSGQIIDEVTVYARSNNRFVFNILQKRRYRIRTRYYSNMNHSFPSSFEQIGSPRVIAVSRRLVFEEPFPLAIRSFGEGGARSRLEHSSQYDDVE